MMSNPHRHGHVRFYILGILLLPRQIQTCNLGEPAACEEAKMPLALSQFGWDDSLGKTG